MLSKEIAFNHANFPISVQSNELEVIITWQEKPSKVLENGQKKLWRRKESINRHLYLNKIKLCEKTPLFLMEFLF